MLHIKRINEMEFEKTVMQSIDLEIIKKDCKWDGVCYDDWKRENRIGGMNEFANLQDNRNANFLVNLTLSYTYTNEYDDIISEGEIATQVKLHYYNLADVSDYELEVSFDDYDMNEFNDMIANNDIQIFDAMSSNSNAYKNAIKLFDEGIKRAEFLKMDIKDDLDFYIGKNDWENVINDVINKTQQAFASSIR